MNEIIIAIVAAIVGMLVYKWYTSSKEGAESGPATTSPIPTTPTTVGGTTGNQVYLIDGDAITTDANGTHISRDMIGGMTISDIDDTRRKILNPMERSKKSQRSLSDRLMMDEMHRNSDGKKMSVGDEDRGVEMDCVQSILSPEDVVPGYIPGRRNLVSLAMTE